MLKKHILPLLSFALLSNWNAASAVETHAHAPGMLGVALHEVFSGEVSKFQLPGEYGAWVEAVAPDSPAEAAGIQVDDVIVGYNGIRVESARALRRMVQESPAGRTVELRLVRMGSPVLVRATLGEGREVAPMMASEPRAPRKLGVGVEPISLQLADLYDLNDGEGLFVAQVQKGSLAERAGILARDILVSVEDTAITTGERLSELLNDLPGADAVFTVIRNGVRENVTVRF